MFPSQAQKRFAEFNSQTTVHSHRFLPERNQQNRGKRHEIRPQIVENIHLFHFAHHFPTERKSVHLQNTLYINLQGEGNEHYLLEFGLLRRYEQYFHHVFYIQRMQLFFSIFCRPCCVRDENVEQSFSRNGI